MRGSIGTLGITKLTLVAYFDCMTMVGRCQVEDGVVAPSSSSGEHVILLLDPIEEIRKSRAKIVAETTTVTHIEDPSHFGIEFFLIPVFWVVGIKSHHKRIEGQ